jgi:hypothetical protein
MNNFHRYINLPFEVQKPEIFNNHHDVVKHEMLPLDFSEAIPVIEFIDQFGLMCSHLEYFYTPPGGGKVLIHTDNGRFDNMTKINVTWGPKEGVTRWWNCPTYRPLEFESDNTEYGETDSYHSVYTADEKDSTLLYEANTNRPSLINVGLFHSTHNPGSYGRYTLCFILFHKDSEKNLQWDDAIKLFSNYLSD